MQNKLIRPRYHGKDEDGGPIISLVDSFILWKDLCEVVTHYKYSDYQPGVTCPYCNGQQWINTFEYGYIRCICNIKYWDRHYSTVYRDLRSRSRLAKLDELIVWGEREQQNSINDALSTINKWIVTPRGWLLLQGPVGTGKTHMLFAINSILYPFSMYITANDLETLVFQNLQDRQLDDLVNALATAPVLLLDDLTSDYGKDFFRATLRKVFDQRYRNWEELPTVVATNMPRDEIRSKYDPRIGDRLSDEMCKYIVMKGQSWRRYGDHQRWHRTSNSTH